MINSTGETPVPPELPPNPPLIQGGIELETGNWEKGWRARRPPYQKLETQARCRERATQRVAPTGTGNWPGEGRTPGSASTQAKACGYQRWCAGRTLHWMVGETPALRFIGRGDPAPTIKAETGNCLLPTGNFFFEKGVARKFWYGNIVWLHSGAGS